MALHVLAAVAFWETWKFAPVFREEPEVEWTWSAPAPERSVQGRGAPIKSAEKTADAASALSTQPPQAAPAPEKESKVAPATFGTPPSKETARAAPSTGDAAGPAVPSSPPPSQTDDAKSIGDPFGGDSTGYALIPPRIKDRPPIALSPEAAQMGLSGNVLLVVEVLEDGQVGKIILSRSSGSKILDELARENVARWRFDPARQPQGAKPVRVLTSIWVRFAKGGS